MRKNTKDHLFVCLFYVFSVDLLLHKLLVPASRYSQWQNTLRDHWHWCLWMHHCFNMCKYFFNFYFSYVYWCKPYVKWWGSLVICIIIKLGKKKKGWMRSRIKDLGHSSRKVGIPLKLSKSEAWVFFFPGEAFWSCDMLCVPHRVCSLNVWEGKCSSQEGTHWWASAAFCSLWLSLFR